MRDRRDGSMHGYRPEGQTVRAAPIYRPNYFPSAHEYFRTVHRF